MIMRGRICNDEDFYKIVITLSAIICYCVGSLIEMPGLILLTLIAFEVWVGNQMCVIDNHYSFSYDKISVLCCILYNSFFFIVSSMVSDIKSSIFAIFVLVLIIRISIKIGYETGKKSAVTHNGYTFNKKANSKFTRHYYSDAEETTRQNNNDQASNHRNNKTFYEEDTQETNYEKDKRGNESHKTANDNYNQTNPIEDIDYFWDCRTKEDLKKRYRSLSKKYHPDNKDTGDEKVFVIINEQYKKRIVA